MKRFIVALLIGCSSEQNHFLSEESDGGEETTPVEDSAIEDSIVAVEDSMTTTDTGTPMMETSVGVDPPFGGSSKGTGGAAAMGTVVMAGGVTYRMIAPAPTASMPLMIVFSGTEGGATMTSNLMSVRGMTGTASFLFAVLDGKDYFDNGAAGATALDDVRKKYDVDNDRTYLLSESAGTRAGLKLGFHLRQSYFAAYWANDVNFADGPEKNAATLGFAPHGQSGPGGALALATEIVTKMKAGGYRVPTPAPYDGPGSTTHGAPQQFIAAVSWFPGKTRK
jgi:hypothetical protein